MGSMETRHYGLAVDKPMKLLAVEARLMHTHHSRKGGSSPPPPPPPFSPLLCLPSGGSVGEGASGVSS